MSAKQGKSHPLVEFTGGENLKVGDIDESRRT